MLSQRLLRHFPYTEMLLPFMPVVAALWAIGRTRSPAALAALVPFVGAFAAGFVYNDVCDLRDPPRKRNPVVEGALSEGSARSLVGVLLAGSVLSFAMLYRSRSAWAAFGLYLLLGLAYSGLGLRFKERPIGPLVASVVVWTGGPTILAIEYGLTEVPVWLVLGGMFLVYAAREIHHMVADHACDAESGYRTFVVRFGVPRSRLVEHVVFSIGLILLVLAVCAAGQPLPASGPWLTASLIALPVVALAVQLRGNPVTQQSETRLSYWLVRLWLVVFAVVLLSVPPVCAALTLWAFVTSERS